MKCQKVALVGFCLFLVSAFMATDVSQTLAQRRPSVADRKQHPGKYSTWWPRQRASRSMRHARDYSRDLYYYSRDAATIKPEVAKSESEQLGKNIEAAKKELATVRKQAGSDKDTLDALQVIEKHLASAAETHKTLHAECRKESVDVGVCANCCNQITKEL